MKNCQCIINGQAYDALLTESLDEQQLGLMYQPWPPPIMVFLYYAASKNKFWMKNTPSPLDIVFAHKNKIIDICEGKPLCLDPIGPEEETDLIVEFPKGFCKENNIKKSDSIFIK